MHFAHLMISHIRVLPRYVRSFMTCPGGFGVSNMARCNPHSPHFNWRNVNGAQILFWGDLPALCFMAGFCKSSSILEPTMVGNTGNHAKDVSLHPLSAHEWERNLTGIAIAAKEMCRVSKHASALPTVLARVLHLKVCTSSIFATHLSNLKEPKSLLLRLKLLSVDLGL